MHRASAVYLCYMPEWQGHIVSEPEIMYGKPCIKGTRIPVDLILDKLAAGQSMEDLLEGYPQLSKADLLACLQYGADAVRNNISVGHDQGRSKMELAAKRLEKEYREGGELTAFTAIDLDPFYEAR